MTNELAALKQKWAEEERARIEEFTRMPTLTFDAERHEFRLDDRVIPSVTQILEAEGVIDARWYTEESRELGIAVHEWCAADDRGEAGALADERIIPYVEAWRAAREGMAVHQDWTEKPVSNSRLMYAGIMDRLVTLDKDVYLLDLKTGAPERWHALQTAAYAYCDEMRLMDARRASVYLRDDGTFRFGEHLDGRDVQTFCGIVLLHNWRQG